MLIHSNQVSGYRAQIRKGHAIDFSSAIENIRVVDQGATLKQQLLFMIDATWIGRSDPAMFTLVDMLRTALNLRSFTVGARSEAAIDSFINALKASLPKAN